ILETLEDHLAQVVYRELRRVDDLVCEASDGRHALALLADAFGDGEAVAERVRAAGFAESALQGLVACFDEDQCSGVLAGKLAINSRQKMNLRAFARVYQQGRALHFASAAFVELAEGGNQ